MPPALAGEVAREAAAERDAALAAAGEKVPRRRARLLPPWLAVYFTLALCLLARLPYQDALRSLAGDGATGLAVPAVTVAVKAGDGIVRVEVTDCGGPGDAGLRPAGADAEGGRGLQLVAGLAAAGGAGGGAAGGR